MKPEPHQNQQIREAFAALRTKKDLAELLNLANQFLYGEEAAPLYLKTLTYYADPRKAKDRYQTFTIQKKSGAERLIHAPVKGLKTILRALNFILQCIHSPHQAATGFVTDKSIVDNARQHIGSPYVYNLDLKDFFHSFDRNRVKLGLMYAPFHLNGPREPLAFLLASLCTHPLDCDGEVRTVLPQGSPTSPTLTNILCQKLDHRLNGLAKRFGLVYTRYADDITFSSGYDCFRNPEFQSELRRIIEEDQQLRIHPDKTRLQRLGYRQEATGLIVNEKVNVRRRYVKQLRMWIYFWERYGYAKAQQIFLRDYLRDKGHLKDVSTSSLQQVCSGKLEFLKMVKGPEDSTYQQLASRFHALTTKEKASASGATNLERVVDTILGQGLEQGLRLYDSFKTNKR
ncbi:RNA-directed DNA polymerase [Nitritalea halalkaliphila LW7]|uniref:RNA-directed DNA polymerase n=1 Tax=Nitritalea halalkaliphila LW7 TaxID=1189621 RepID=I5BYD9_9BACT|nr:reverse transcriptase family protein [Nitritalea halalkaliphila]EIM74591.1 RNA-directed DNA polymerase [Nitritalea halalkaliphila LW7]